jgi:hypothetical protein
MASLYAGGRATRYAAQNQPQGPVLSFAEQQAQKAAESAGFKSPEAQSSNRMARDILEMKASAAGIPYAEAYKAAGSDLTNTDAIIKAYQGIPNQPVQQQQQEETKDPGPPTVKPTEQSEQYKSDADKILAGIEALLGGLPDYGAEMKQMREDFAQSQRTLAANMSMSQKTPNLQIQPASGTPQTGGTQSFRRRPRQFGGGAAGTVLAGLNLGQPSMMNV